jgi:hypothetical protein
MILHSHSAVPKTDTTDDQLTTVSGEGYEIIDDSYSHWATNKSEIEDSRIMLVVDLWYVPAPCV